MPLWEVILLAVIQGITEFLPVSSSGHLVVADALCEEWTGTKLPNLLEVSIVLHMGTLAAVIAFYRREIAEMLTTDRRVIPALIVATIPAGAVGVFIKKVLGGAGLENVLLAGFMFPVTAAGLLWVTRRAGGDLDYQRLRLKGACFIGLLQAVAILPGISRSGATLVGGLSQGLRRESAAAFAFLMSIPVTAGAGLLEALDIWEAGGTTTPFSSLAVGFFVSLVVGWGALAMLISWVRAGRLHLFAYYLMPLGVAVCAWQLLAK